MKISLRTIARGIAVLGLVSAMATPIVATAQTVKKDAKKVGKKTGEGAEKVADKTKDGLSKTGEVMNDGWITTKVKSQFVGEDLLKDSDINVDSNNHVVTLKGHVMTSAARTKAASIARSTEGVRRVINQLTVSPKK
jgi:osmotically-inducible protein OsmY